MPKSERQSSAKPALIYLTPVEIRCPPFSRIRHETREENPCLFPGTFFLLPVPPLRVLPTGTRLSPPRPVPEGPHSRLLHFQRLHLHGAMPGVSQHPPDRAAPGGPYLPCRCPGTAAAVPPPSSPADSSGVSGQRRARRAGEMETETHQGLRQREEEREGCPIAGSPEPGNSDSCAEQA